jgi:hypothetical protein
MGKQEDRKTVTRRDVLKLAGTAAAFCTSFGFLHGGQTGGALQSKHLKLDANKELQIKWKQAEIKWYRGDELLHSSEFPAKVMKHLQADEMASIEIKWFRGGQFKGSLGRIIANS